VLELAGVGEEHIRAGLKSAVWPGRFELLEAGDGKQVLLDAAHNPAKCEALARAVRQYFPGRKVLLVVGVLADKEAPAMLPPLLALADRVWTTTPESPRQMPAAELAGLCVRAGFPAERVAAADPPAAAVQQALGAAGEADLVLVTGSFYTVGPVRRCICP